MTQPTGAPGERLYSLDAARAVAALAVVFQHWEHFLSVAPFAAAREQSPLYWLFAPFYDKGARAVTFFFCLSGFIFYWLYARKVHDRAVGPARFAALRLSRLYPLHLATLLFVLALQWPLISMLGEPFIYQNHDIKHFVLNLLLVQYWGLEDGWSFNGPSWSISVEIFLYIAFFLACRYSRPSVWQCLLLALAGLLLARFSVLANAAVPFFIGGAAYHAYRLLAPRWTPVRAIALVAIVIMLWAIIPSLIQPGVLDGLLARLENLLGGAPGKAASAVLRVFAERQFEFVLFPATVAALALSEAVWKRAPWAALHELGNMSYGIYLLHFPVQLVFISAALALHFPRDFFLHPATLFLFIAVLLAVAFASYRFFEKPAMLALRRLWSRRPGSGRAFASPAASAARPDG
jgi:peptidoglycan/LPS O-acetylase OafA/YrhL